MKKLDWKSRVKSMSEDEDWNLPFRGAEREKGRNGYFPYPEPHYLGAGITAQYMSAERTIRSQPRIVSMNHPLEDYIYGCLFGQVSDWKF